MSAQQTQLSEETLAGPGRWRKQKPRSVRRDLLLGSLRFPPFDDPI